MNECWKNDPFERPLPGDVEIQLTQVLTRYQNAQQQQQQQTNRTFNFHRSNSCNTQYNTSATRNALNRNLVNSPLNSPSSNLPLNYSPLVNQSPLCRMNGGGGGVQPSFSTTTDEQSNLFGQYNQSINVQN